MAQNNHSVYLVTNLVNNKFYVGKTAETVDNRWKKHVSSAKSGSEYYFHRAIRKHGEGFFDRQIIAGNLTNEDAANLERVWILLLESHKDDFGYNLTLGGEGQRANEETRKKLSERQLGEKNHNFGKRNTEEYKQNMSDKLKGRIFSEETIQKMKEAQKGHPTSEMAKQRQKESALKRWSNLELREETSRVQKSLWQDPAHREKMTTLIRQNYIDNPNMGMSGKKHSEETKEKMRATWALKREAAVNE